MITKTDFLVVGLIVVLVINELVEYSSADCGLPAIPVGSQISQIKSLYNEGEAVDYRCEWESAKLIDGGRRTCRESLWQGKFDFHLSN